MEDKIEREERNARQIRRILNHSRLNHLWKELREGYDNVDIIRYTIKGTIHKKDPYYLPYANAYGWFENVLDNIGSRWAKRQERIRDDDNKNKSSKNRNKLTENLEKLAGRLNN